MEKIKTKKGIKYREKIYIQGKAVASPCFSKKSLASSWKRLKLQEREKLKAFGSSYIEPIPFEEFGEIFLTNKASLAKRTVEFYSNVFHQHLKPFLGTRLLSNLRLSDGEKLKSNLLKSKLSPKRINNILNVLKIMMNEAVRTEYILKSPFQNLGFIPLQEKQVRYWLPHEVEKFLFSSKDDYYLPVYILTLNLGLRLSEVFGLRWHSVKFSEGIVTIQESRSRDGLQVHTKSKRVRNLPMNDTVANCLKALRENSPGIEYVFTDPNGNPVDYQHFTQRVFYKAVEKAGVRKIRFHDLRSTYASNFVLNGGNIFALSKLLGHSSVKITEERYADLNSDYLKSQSSIVQFAVKPQDSPKALILL